VGRGGNGVVARPMARHRLAAAAGLGWREALGPEAGGRTWEQQPAWPPNGDGPPRGTQVGQINASELMFGPEIEASLRRFRLKSSVCGRVSGQALTGVEAARIIGGQVAAA